MPQDPRDIITPDAFELDQRLLNRPLASPTRRGVAMAIDLLVVSTLAASGGVLFILLVLLTWRMRKRQWKAGKWLSYLLYLLLALAIIPTILTLWATKEVSEGHVGDVWTLTKAGLCQDVDCLERHLPDLATLAEGDLLTQAERGELAREITDRFPEAEQAEARQSLEKALRLSAGSLTAPATTGLDAPVAEQAIESEAVPDAGLAPGEEQDIAAATEETPEQAMEELQQKLDKQRRQNRSLREQLEQEQQRSKGAFGFLVESLKELGLGFGWAAFYFTVFVAWFDGQTVGKKLTRCRVRQLDGTPLSLWDAFGRYGGYGAGIATGLLGFAQIYWDPNRQAIQDKISTTVVEDLRPQARLRARKWRKGEKGRWAALMENLRRPREV
ncbi:RDD family protein [Ferrimonas marina]|uniref:RDD family protein n=1 Tax=Ferrimonas marina TaxID=299255 RepID=A0A1M5XZN6_9GAMM|nr:RDD family protein [Ferrimonas marina]SHI05277.1 RDD family protein [Ferrimonas marina]